MITSLIIVLELGLLSLLLLLAFRVLSLNRSEPLISGVPSEIPLKPGAFRVRDNTSAPEAARASSQTDKCELISQLHILASLQSRDCKLQGFDLEAAHPTVREHAVCWLYGAACALSNPEQSHSEAVAVLVSQFASRKLGIRQPEALAALSTLTRQETSLCCFRTGIEGAEFWKSHHFVPRENSLFEAVTSNTLV
jgi:hypothetical protein